LGLAAAAISLRHSVPRSASSPYSFLLKLYADGGYQGVQFKAALQRVMRQVNLEIVKRSDAAKAFIVPAEALDCRENHRIAQPLPQTGQGLGMSEQQRPSLSCAGLNTPHAAKALSLNAMISDDSLREHFFPSNIAATSIQTSLA
jgi:hypothetical protein